jgi:hypothetical protein
MKSVHPYRILLCHTLFPTDQNPKIVGGAERSSLDLALGLWQERGHHVEVLRGLPPGVPARIETLGAIKVHCLPLRRPYWLHDGKPRSSLEKLYWHWSDDHGAVPKGTGALLDEVRPDILLLGNIVR